MASPPKNTDTGPAKKSGRKSSVERSDQPTDANAPAAGQDTATTDTTPSAATAPPDGKSADGGAGAGHKPSAATKPAEPPPSPAAPPPRRAPRGPGLRYGFAVLLIAIAAALYVTWPSWRGILPADLARAIDGSAGRDALATREDRLARVEAQLARVLAAMPGEEFARAVADGQSTLSARLDAAERQNAALSDRVGTLEQRIAGLAETLETLRLGMATPRDGEIDPKAKAALEQLNAQVAALQAEAGAAAQAREARAGASRAESAASGLVLAVGQLREAMRGAGPFEAELTALGALAGPDSEIGALTDTIAPHARAGVPTLAMLQTGFDPVARRIVQAAIAPQGQGWIEQTLQRLSTVVTVRRTGANVTGDGPEALVARAEIRLAAGDLGGAIAELEKLQGAPAGAASAWLSDARARRAIDDAASRLSGLALAELHGESGRAGDTPAGDGAQPNGGAARP